jgi:hypothetical protein
VELSDLRLLQRSIEAADASAFTYRIVLVHHHLLPLPYPPREFVRRRIKKILRATSDEAFKLLENAGLTTDFLLKGSVNLVLHGHEHKEFAASVNYHGPSGERHVMAVVGGPAARTGFQVIYFRRNGDVELVRYGFKEADYEVEAEIALWSYNDWKRLDWERQSRKNGYYEQAKHLFELSETGDAQQTTDVTDIVGGENTISRIPFISTAGDSKFGRVALHSVYDKEAEVEVPTSCLPPSGPEFSFPFKVSPEATRRRPHRGYEAVRISSNNFALTQEEMRLRTSEGEPPPSEHVNITHRNPVRRTVLTLSFPRRYLPSNIDVKALYRNVAGRPEDIAESLRARRKLVDCSKDGLVVLDLDWVTPNHQYQLTWELPSQEYLFNTRGGAVAARFYMEQLASLQEDDKEKFQEALSKVRDNCLDLIAEKVGESGIAKFLSPQNETLSLWGYDRERREIRVIAGTFESNSSFWTASVQYGAGVRGKAMRRGLPEFWRLPSQKNTDYYHQCDGCDRERFLLAVPISVREDPSERPVEHGMGLCWLVACLGSTQEESLLSRLVDPTLHREVAVFLHHSMVNTMKGFVAGGQQSTPS